MSLSQFSCPHCHSPFQVDTSLPSLQIACPHCGRPVTLANEPPLSGPPVVEPPLAARPDIDALPVNSTIAELPPSVPRGYPPADVLPPNAAVSTEEVPAKQAAQHKTIADDYRSRHLAAEERAARKLVKNMIVWVCCAIVLVSILAFFLVQGGS